MRNSLYTAVGLCIIVSSLSLTLGCQKKNLSSSVDQAHTKQVEVETLSPYTGTKTHDYPGVIQPKFIYTLGFRVAGRIIERKYDTGTVVTQNTLLSRIDPTPYQLQYNVAQSRAEASASSQKQALAQLKRAEQLKAAHFISDAAFEDFYTKAQLSQQQYKAALAEQHLAKQNLLDTQLFSPRAGVIMNTPVDVGQVVAAGQPIMNIADQNQPEIAFSLPEEMVTQAHLGMLIRFSLISMPKQYYPARISSIARMADPSSRTYAVRATIVHPKASFRLGMSTTVRMNSKQSWSDPVFTVPLSAVGVDNGHHYLYRIQNAHCERIAIEARDLTDQGYLISSSALRPGDHIITKGIELLHDQEPVIMHSEPSKAAS